MHFSVRIVDMAQSTSAELACTASSDSVASSVFPLLGCGGEAKRIRSEDTDFFIFRMIVANNSNKSEEIREAGFSHFVVEPNGHLLKGRIMVESLNGCSVASVALWRC